VAGTLVLAACSQTIDYTYSRKNFSSSTFEADLSACKHQSPSNFEHKTSPSGQDAQPNDAAVRECMIAKGYKIGTGGGE
jgi:hypothetical protein